MPDTDMDFKIFLHGYLKGVTALFLAGCLFHCPSEPALPTGYEAAVLGSVK